VARPEGWKRWGDWREEEEEGGSGSRREMRRRGSGPNRLVVVSR
jgi:hypothetical protein